uniref:NXPE C-terminal domain-containing protein n=1 Tax=Cyprinus carpio carpio TaxID=630221 RepID=A0A8C1DFX3_CYPCA
MYFGVNDILVLSQALWALTDGIHIKLFQPTRPKPVPRNNSSSIITAFDMGISDEEWERLQKAIDWPIPDQEITHLSQSTSPVHSTFSIVGLKESYKVGEKISVIITARDHNKNLKRYGGDFFKAKLFNAELKASVYGEVVDHRNGTYSVALLLPWEGQAQVSVRLEHSSEVVQILKKYRESSFPRSHYNGYFEGPGLNETKIFEVVECNLKWGADGSWRKGDCCCEYKDIKTGTVWQCERPKELSCDHLVHHSYGHLESPLNLFENLTNIAISGDIKIINVLPTTAPIGKFNGTMEKCRSGMTTPVPAGFYLNDVWKSFVCNTRQFSPAQMANCLKNKIVYLMGDSTTRQWFEYLERNVPGKCDSVFSIQLFNIQLDSMYNYKFNKVLTYKDLHYISNDIDEMAGGPHAVIVFTFFAHLVFHPITFYVYEVARIRQSVVALLRRAPETTVIIKSGNTAGLKYIVTPLMFRDIDGVIFLDVWQMTSCHYLREHIHPGPVVIANEVNMFLSYVSPSCGLFKLVLFHKENGKLSWLREG